MAEKKIYHVVQDRKDPTWDDWSVYEGDKFLHSAWRLREVRDAYDTRLKRGMCPHFDGEVCGFTKDEDPRSWDFSVYWFEIEDK